MKIPESLSPELASIASCKFAANALPLPLFSSVVSAGFPSPADDFIETTLDLNQFLIKRPAATFFVRVSGDSMIGVGIHPNDVLVVDRSLPPKTGNIIIAVVDGEMTVKRLASTQGIVTLYAENPNYHPLQITEGMDFRIWGVVTSVIHALI